MTPPGITEPVIAGIIVSLLNKLVLNNFNLFNCCKDTFYEIDIESDGDNGAENSTINYIHHPVHVHS